MARRNWSNSRHPATTRNRIGNSSKPYTGFPPVHSRSPDSEYLYVTQRTGVIPLGPSNGKVVTTEWSYENGTFAEVDDPSGSVVEILKPTQSGAPETAHTARQCLDHPNPEPDSHLPAAATGPHPSQAMSFLIEAGNSQVKMKTTKT